jgi:hypothetical protein
VIGSEEITRSTRRARIGDGRRPGLDAVPPAGALAE